MSVPPQPLNPYPQPPAGYVPLPRRSKPPWEQWWFWVIGAVVVMVIVTSIIDAVGGGESADDAVSPSSPAEVSVEPSASQPSESSANASVEPSADDLSGSTPEASVAPSADEPSDPPADAPDVVGIRLDVAEATLKAAGWKVEHFDSYSNRTIFDRGNWEVTSQESIGQTILLGAQKPDDGVTTPPPVGDPPDVVGMRLDRARTLLEADNWDVSAFDADQSRLIVLESNWVVVSQEVDGATVWLGVQK